jgi:hypothetical protein
MVDESGEIPAGKEAIVANPEEADEGVGDGKGQSSGLYRVLEYDFKAQEIVEWRRELASTACGRIGIDVQFVTGDTAQQGRADTGTALRVRLMPSVNATRQRAAGWDTELPRVGLVLQLLGNLSAEQGGLGQPWADPATQPSVDRGPALPEDPAEATTEHSTAVTAGIESTETAVRARNPGWSDKQVKDEVARIREDQKASSAFAGTSLFGGATPPAPPTQ